MYSGAATKRDTNPRENASLLQIILFLYAYKTIRKGARKDIENEDVFEIMKDYDSEKLGNRLEALWKEEIRKPRPWLLCPIFKVFGLTYVFLGISIVIVETIMVVSEPIFTGKLVSYFTPKSKLTREDALMYAAGLIGCTLGWSMFDHNYLMMSSQLAMKIRIACCSLIYRKCLKLNLNHVSQFEGGKVVTLMTKDVGYFETAMDLLHALCEALIQLFFMTYIMYNEIGISALYGTSFLFLMFPLNVYLARQVAIYRLSTAERTDQRVKITQEILTAMRTIKMYTWELFFSKSVSALRKKEIRCLRILSYIKAVGLSIGQLSSRLAFYICVMSYIAMGNHITAEKAFVVTGCFLALNRLLAVFMPLGFAQIAELRASLQRMTSFLQLEEVSESKNANDIDEKQPRLSIQKALVKSDKGVDVLEDVSLEAKPGVNLIIGPTGAGKSTLLKLLLGDVKKTKGSVEVAGRISYASQEPWLFPGTVKQNIIFGEWFDEKRYQAVISVCALKQDLERFSDGDRTVLTDRGLNLSRGQKARINLARAVYRSADIYLLDDCMSAVDARVGKHIFYECIKGFLKDRICVLVTHYGRFVRGGDNIVILNKGRVNFQGNYVSLKEWDREIYQSMLDSKNYVEENEDNSEVQQIKAASGLDTANESTKLLPTGNIAVARSIYEETKTKGAVSKLVYYVYLTSGGGLKMLLLLVALSIATQVSASWSDYFVSFWVDMEQELSGFRFNQTTNSTEYKQLQESHGSIMKLYSFVIFAATLVTITKSFAFFIFGSYASVNIHKSVLTNVLNAYMGFFDKHLSGNILNRFSRDLGILDESVHQTIAECITITLSILSVLFVISSVHLILLVPSAIFAVILIFAQRLYMPTGRSIRRLEGATRSPVIGHLNATLEGVTTIRACQAQQILRKEFDRHQDLYNSVSYMNLATTRAFGFYLDMLCVFYITVIILTFLCFETETLAGKVGLAITQSFSLSGVLQWTVRHWSELENQMTSTERVLEYTKIEPEQKLGYTVTNWPSNGRIAYSDVNLRYSPNNERVLKGITFIVEPKEKLGIVGRTGAGKSSVISILYRLYEFEGTITIDGVDITSLSIELLRSKISIIPQDPVLFSGTIRDNLDPYKEHSDKELWDALEEVAMKTTIDSLMTTISEAGSNFSIGQRQLLCVARAIIRKNLILVLDEATANIDPQTDSLIQRIIRKKFADCTVITIAHRLHTIIDSDRVLVMDAGVLVENGNPRALLNSKRGVFYNMVKEAGLL